MDMDKDYDVQDLEAKAGSMLAAPGDVEEIPVALEKLPMRSRKSSESEKKIPPLDPAVIASLPAAAILNEQARLRDLFAKGKRAGKLDAAEVIDAMDEITLTPDQVDQIYDSLEQLGVTLGASDLPDADADEEEPSMEAIAATEEEELIDPNELVDSFSIDDPVRMYLKEIGKVALLSADDERELASDMSAGVAAQQKLAEGGELSGEERAALKAAAAKGEASK